MNRFLSYGIILVGLLFAHGRTVFCEEKSPLYPMTTWICSDQMMFSLINANINNETGAKYFEDFPDEIDINSGWNGIVVTDGNDQWTIMSLGVRRFSLDSTGFTEEKIDDKEFRERLLKTAVVSMLFRKEFTKIILRRGSLYLVSNGFPLDRLDDLNPEQHWASLQEKYHSAFLFESPEWILYPELPPKKENEGTFLKKLREKRSKEDYKKDDSVVSTLFAMNWSEQGDFKGIWTTKLKDGTEESKQIEERQKRNAPFGLAGFFRENGPSGLNGSLFYRWYPEDKIFGEAKLLLKIGITPLAQEEQKKAETTKTSALKFYVAVLTESVETLKRECLEDGYDMINESNLLFATPIYSDDITDDENYLQLKSENEAFRKCLDAIRDLTRTIRIGSEGWEKNKPVDLGLLVDAETLTLAASIPSGGTIPDSASILPVIAQVNEFLEKVYTISKDKHKDFPLLSLHLVHEEIENMNETQFSVGQITLKSDAGEIPLLAFLSATKNDFYAFQMTTKGLLKIMEFPKDLFELPDLPDMNTLMKKNYSLFKERVEESLSEKRDNCPAPESFALMDADGLHARLDEHFFEREYSYSLTLRKDSLGLFGLLSKWFGPDAVKRFVPF